MQRGDTAGHTPVPHNAKGVTFSESVVGGVTPTPTQDDRDVVKRRMGAARVARHRQAAAASARGGNADAAPGKGQTLYQQLQCTQLSKALGGLRKACEEGPDSVRRWAEAVHHGSYAGARRCAVQGWMRALAASARGWPASGPAASPTAEGERHKAATVDAATQTDGAASPGRSGKEGPRGAAKVQVSPDTPPRSPRREALYKGYKRLAVKLARLHASKCAVSQSVLRELSATPRTTRSTPQSL